MPQADWNIRKFPPLSRGMAFARPVDATTLQQAPVSAPISQEAVITNVVSAPLSPASCAASAACLALILAAGSAQACDGKSYAFTVAVGAAISGGGLSIRLDRAKLIDDNDTPDKYYISIKDDGKLLGDHVLLRQYDTINFQTKCGDVSIGADRSSFLSGGTLRINWSYF